MEQKFDLRSKLIDGLLASGVLVLLSVLVILLVNPILVIFDRPGMLVYTVVLVAITAICLERSMSNRDPEMTRAWWGILSGVGAWVVIKFSDWLGSQAIINETGIINLLLVVLIASVLWRKVNFVGLHYFIVVIFMGWISHIALASIMFLSSYIPQFQNVLIGTGILFAAIMAASVVYIVVRSQTRMDRLNAALVIWFSAMIMIYVFRGRLM